jgi:hypothetical protein
MEFLKTIEVKNKKYEVAEITRDFSPDGRPYGFYGVFGTQGYVSGVEENKEKFSYAPYIPHLSYYNLIDYQDNIREVCRVLSPFMPPDSKESISFYMKDKPSLKIPLKDLKTLAQANLAEYAISNFVGTILLPLKVNEAYLNLNLIEPAAKPKWFDKTQDALKDPMLKYLHDWYETDVVDMLNEQKTALKKLKARIVVSTPDMLSGKKSDLKKNGCSKVSGGDEEMWQKFFRFNMGNTFDGKYKINLNADRWQTFDSHSITLSIFGLRADALIDMAAEIAEDLGIDALVCKSGDKIYKITVLI